MEQIIIEIAWDNDTEKNGYTITTKKEKQFLDWLVENGIFSNDPNEAMIWYNGIDL